MRSVVSVTARPLSHLYVQGLYPPLRVEVPCLTRSRPLLPFCTAPMHRVYTHHYEQYMDLSMFNHATETVSSIIESYNAIDTAPPPPVTRFRSRGLSFI